MIKPESKTLSFFSIAEITWEWSRAPLAHALPTSDVEKSHWELEITLIDEMVFGLWDDFVSVGSQEVTPRCMRLNAFNLRDVRTVVGQWVRLRFGLDRMRMLVIH